MAHYWRIERQNYHHETQYLAKVQPTQWVWDLENAMEFSDDTIIDACEWLVLMGVSFTVRQFTRV